MSADSDTPKSRPAWILPLVTLAVGGAAAFGALQTEQGRSMLGLVPAAEAGTVPEEAPMEFGEFVELDAIVVNPRGSEGRRYMMLKLGVEAEEAETLEVLATRKPAVTDAVIDVIATQSARELDDITRRDSLKEAIRTRFNEILGEEGEVSRLYFTQYVLQ